TQNSGSSCMFVEGRGNWVDFARDPATGNIISKGVEHGKRTEAFLQTDLNFIHEFKVSKTNQAMRLRFNLNVQNVLNQHAVLSTFFTPFRTGAVALASTANPTGFDFNGLMTGYDYVAAANGAGNTVNGPLIYSNRYGLPNVFQGARQMRFQVK